MMNFKEYIQKTGEISIIENPSWEACERGGAMFDYLRSLGLEKELESLVTPGDWPLRGRLYQQGHLMSEEEQEAEKDPGKIRAAGFLGMADLIRKKFPKEPKA